ncbi:MAG: glycosyltransferase [Chlorobaculum sp.]|nr:glycosyltransferase [Chlorobaculum sp.]
MQNPKVSILMPVYNGEKHLREAIDSMLCQNFSDFEFIIIDDGSSDHSIDIIKSYTDKRIQLFCNQSNCGIIKSLNKGLQIVQGEYIIRMDCDDISLPDRISKQVHFMDANQNIGISGTGMHVFKNGKNKYIRTQPVHDTELKVSLLFHTCFFHPTVIIRKSVIEGHWYPDDLMHVEDYNFWVYMSDKTTFGNLEDVLLLYRIHDNQISTTKDFIQTENTRYIRLAYLNKIFYISENVDTKTHNLIADNNKQINLLDAKAWLEYLDATNQKHCIFDKLIFQIELGKKWWHCCKNNIRHSRNALDIYKSSHLSTVYRPKKSKFFKTYLKKFYF